MLVWNPEGVDDALWRELLEHFSEEELIELGSFIALTFGQQRWIKTLAIGHGEMLPGTMSGLAAGSLEEAG